jgi:hypothetical protein
MAPRLPRHHNRNRSRDFDFVVSSSALTAAAGSTGHPRQGFFKSRPHRATTSVIQPTTSWTTTRRQTVQTGHQIIGHDPPDTRSAAATGEGLLGNVGGPK